MASAQRVEIGFEGGQVISARLAEEDLKDLRGQLEKGVVPRAYRALLSYMMGLRTHFRNIPAGFDVSSLYQGYMDMTYFALFPYSLKRHNLKIALVFNYDAYRFEAWLAGGNRKVQRQYWELFKGSQWPKYRVDNGSVSEVVFEPAPRLMWLNETAHLRDHQAAL